MNDLRNKNRKEILYEEKVPSSQEIYSFYEALGWEPFLGKTPEELHLAMKASWYLICARDEGKLVGMARIVSDGYVNAYLCGLGVLGQYRHRGIGRELMQRCIKVAKEYKLKPQFFCEEELVPYYERMNFKRFAAGMQFVEDHGNEE